MKLLHVYNKCMGLNGNLTKKYYWYYQGIKVSIYLPPR